MIAALSWIVGGSGWAEINEGLAPVSRSQTKVAISDRRVAAQRDVEALDTAEPYHCGFGLRADAPTGDHLAFEGGEAPQQAQGQGSRLSRHRRHRRTAPIGGAHPLLGRPTLPVRLGAELIDDNQRVLPYRLPLRRRPIPAHEARARAPGPVTAREDRGGEIEHANGMLPNNRCTAMQAASYRQIKRGTSTGCKIR